MAVNARVEFDGRTQSLDALRAAAYRLIGSATCEIAEVDGRLVCDLTASRNAPKSRYDDAEVLRSDFLDLVTDENLRERIAARTEGVRNVILSLAFGHIVGDSEGR
jgi:His-Xaa-Ser system protein HxsD